eukprot:jgi/Botrbrau1/3132/Bobra.0070s0104.1
MLLRPLAGPLRSFLVQPGTLTLHPFSSFRSSAPSHVKLSQMYTRHFRIFSPIMMGRRSSKIATRKTAQDMKKSKLYGKIGKLIVQAAKIGGPDPVSNTRLRDVLAQAKLVDCPKEIIERNLKKASDKQQADYTEITYECYGHGGTGFIIECLTDNPVITGIEVKQAVTKGGCKMADPGSVAFNFRRLACVFVTAPETAEEQVFDVATEAGAEDVVPARDEEDSFLGFRVLSKAEDFGTVAGSSNIRRPCSFSR